MGSSTFISLDLIFDADRAGLFHPLLQQGVRVACQVGCPLAELLTRQWGIASDYLSRRISTVFINSRAIDDMEKALVSQDAVIALSGAMPGLVGATMRRGGYYAAMRGAMTHREASDYPASREGAVRVKLFNLLLDELGPGVLERGILISGEELLAFIRHCRQEFRGGCRSARMNGRKIDPELLPDDDSLGRIGTVRLRVRIGDEG